MRSILPPFPVLIADRSTSWPDYPLSCIFQVMDTSGVPPRGFLHGNNFWLGDQKSCYMLSDNTTLPFSEKTRKNNSIYRNPNEEYPPFQLRFFIGRMWHNSTVQYHIETENEVSTWIFYSLYLPIAPTIRVRATRVAVLPIIYICSVKIIHHNKPHLHTYYELLSW